MKILFISNIGPRPTNFGGGQRSDLLCRALRSLGELHLLIVRYDEVKPVWISEMTRCFGPVHIAEPEAPDPKVKVSRTERWLNFKKERLRTKIGALPASGECPRMSAKLDELVKAHRYDVIFTRVAMSGVQTGSARHKPSILDVDDLDWAFFESRMRSKTLAPFARLAAAYCAYKCRRDMPGEYARYDRVLLPNEQNLQTIAHPNKGLLPNVAYFEPGEPIKVLPPKNRSHELLFVGTLAWPPNNESVDWFVRLCWPRIRAKFPDATFNIVGPHLREKNRREWSKVAGVKLTGYVPDLSEAYRHAAFSISAVESGGGTKIKVIESLAYGRTIVVTPHSHHGYQSKLKHEESLLLAEEPEAFADACIRLLGDHELRNRLAANGNAVVREHFSFERLCKVLGESIEQVTGKKLEAEPGPTSARVMTVHRNGVAAGV